MKVYRDYCKTRNKVRSLIRKNKVEYEKLVERNPKENPKKFWEYAKSKMKVRQGIPDLDIPGIEKGQVTQLRKRIMVVKRMTLY